MRRSKSNRRRVVYVRGDSSAAVTIPVPAPAPDPVLVDHQTKNRPVPDRATLAAAITEADTRRPINRPHPTGSCHDCGRAVPTGTGRLYCARCLAARS